MKLTAKQLGLLQTMTKGAIVAPWSNLDLVKLTQMKLASDDFAFGMNGRLSSSKIYRLTAEGRRFLDERAGA